jgi:hypothetical protein
MPELRLPRRLSLALRDFATAALVFLAVAVCASGWPTAQSGAWLTSPAQARLFELAPDAEGVLEAVLSQPVLLPHPAGLEMLSLAMAFGAVFAFNMWLARHIRLVHATYARDP